MAGFTEMEVAEIQLDFQRLSGTTYLDHTGAALYPESVVIQSLEDLLGNCYSNPHSGSSSSRHTGDAVDHIRLRLLKHFNANPSEYCVVFTSGATAALKLVAESFRFNSLIKAYDNVWHPVCKEEGIAGTFAYLEECHTSVLGMRSLAEEKGATVSCFTKDELFSLLSENSSPTIANENGQSHCDASSLFVYPAQCNFSGYKYPLNWIEKVQNGALSHLSPSSSKWYCFVDAATYLSTNLLDLSRWKPDFVSMSFYKMFGYPTGIGALLIKHSSAGVLNKHYYGGGTVFVALSNKNQFVPRSNISDRFEDGTLDYLSIVSLKHGLDWIQKLDIHRIGRYTHSLAAYAARALKELKHNNGSPVVLIYSDADHSDFEHQGSIVNFNILSSEGNVVGFAKVMTMASLHNIQLRTGCFCNPGACKRHLGLTEETVRYHFQSGHVCGDDNDLIDGEPTGSVRVSFGPYNTTAHVDALIEMISKCFVSSSNLVPNGTYKLCHKVIGRLDEISLYPVKSCAKFTVTSWNMDSKGLMYDRMWMVCDNNGVALTQKKEPRLCLIKPVIDLDNGCLRLFAAGSEECTVSLELGGSTLNRSMCRDSKVCEDSVLGLDCGDIVADWLQSTLGKPGLRLLRLNQRKDHQDLSLANQAQFLLINKSSVDWLANRSDSQPRRPLIDRFRANFVVDNVGEAFAELTWPSLSIGDVMFNVDGGCRRCEIICIDQETAERSKEPLRSLVRERGKLQFGIYLTRLPDTNCTVSVGDPVVPQP